MALNPFFLQGSPGEQRLIQDLINEHLKIYGIEVTYIPRKFIKTDNILREVQSSVFDDSFLLEAYVNTYDGYSGSGDILTKFGMSLRDELSLVISKERFDDFILPFLSSLNEDEILLSSRPREGDLVYFPLGNRLFEVKFVEHEQPFYQLGKNYVYEVKCELFEYEDEVINTSVNEIDTLTKDLGFIGTMQLVSYGSTAQVSATIGSGYIREIFLNNDGYGYTSVPNVAISSAPYGGISASAIATIKKVNSRYSVSDILLINAGAGYTVPPSITISGGGGTGAAATCSINTTDYGVINIPIIDGGVGYSTAPSITISGPNGIGVTATAITKIQNNFVQSVYITNPGFGYSEAPTISVSNPEVLVGFGTYLYNELVVGSRSNTIARVKEWDRTTNILKVSFVDADLNITSTPFFPGEIITGTISSAQYSLQNYNTLSYDKYNQNDEIQTEANLILDFSESNPFGTY